MRTPIAKIGKFEQGLLNSTGKQLDWAIEGVGFFRVQQEDGTIAYTRDGSFHRDGNGNLVTSDGLQLCPNIQIPSNVTEVSITPAGLIQGLDPEQPKTHIQMGQLTLARFANPEGLLPIEKNEFLATQEAGQNGMPVEEGNPGSGGLGTIRDRCLESLDEEGVPSGASVWVEPDQAALHGELGTAQTRGRDARAPRPLSLAQRLSERTVLITRCSDTGYLAGSTSSFRISCAIWSSTNLVSLTRRHFWSGE